MIFEKKLMNKKVIRTFLRITFFYAVFLLSSYNLFAQTYYFDYYGVKEGLAQSNVYDIVQDDQGYLWLASESGVSRFDGVSFINYTAEDGIAEGGIKALYKDSNGKIWMGHKTGAITFLDNEKMSIHPISELIDAEITSFLLDKEGNLWISTLGDGLLKLENPYEFNVDSINYEQFKGRRLSDRVFAGTIAMGDTIFFITDAGIRKYNPEENTFGRYNPEGLTSYFQITSMLEDSQGDLWFGTFHGGLYRYMKEDQKFKIYDARDGLANNWISTISEDSKGNVWVGTWGGGITKISEDGLKTFDKENGLDDHKIRKIIEDVEGNILIGTNEHGLAIFKGEKFITFGVDDGLIDQQVWAVTQDKDGKYWFGTNNGISVYSPHVVGRKFMHYSNESHSIGSQIRYLKNDKDGNVWLGTNDNGVSMYNYKTGRFEFNPVINRYIPSMQVTAMDVDKNNHLWVGTMEGLIYYDIDENKSQLLTQIHGLNASDITALYADSKGRVWVGLNNGKGLNVIKDTSFKKIDMEGLFTPKSITEDKDGNIWIGTNTKGVFVCDGEKIINHYTQNDGLLSNLITLLNVDHNNHIYIGTSAGLNKIDNKNKIHTYTEKSGFTGIEAKDNATFLDADGNLWFGTIQGVIKYQPALDVEVPHEPLTHISRLRVNLKDRAMIPDQKLSFTENSIIFDYNSVCLTNPDAVRYQIMLDPADKDWRPVTTQTVTNYSSLAPGNYVFKVKARNSDGVWNSESITYSFIIKPPFYKSWWFILSVVLFGIISIITYIKVRERNLIKEKKILEEKVQERTEEVVQKSIELEKKNKDITDSIRYAERIQVAVLPPEVPFSQTFVFFKPKDIVSGDFYWLETFKDKEMIAAVDCTGHGVPGAFLSILGHSMLTKIVREYGILTPAEILDQLDIEIINALHQKNVKGERVVNDGMDLALISYDKKNNILEYSGAYNPLILIRNGELTEIKADRFPIGMTSVHDTKKFTNHTIKVEKGDTFYVFSDGYADQFGGEDGRKFRKKNMKDLLLSIQDKSMEEQKQELDRFIKEWMGNHEQVDDMVFIGRRF